MPSLWHDTAIDLFRDDPGLVGRALRLADVKLAADARLFLAPSNETDRMLSRDLDPDLVLVEGSVEKPERVIVVELQRATDASKLRQWPRYAAAKWLRYECPVILLVICPDEKTAEWYARPIPTTLREYIHWPTILRSAQVPAFIWPELPAADPALGVMSVAYHGDNERVIDAFAAGILSLGPDQAQKYYEYGLRLSPEVVRDVLEHLMATKYSEPFSKLGRRYYGQGREEGRQEGREEGREQGREEGLIAGERGTVHMVLKARHFEITDDQRRLIDTCDDLPTLKAWAEAAVSADTVEKVFGGA